MGCKSGREIDSPLGCFGLNHTNESGLRFLTYLAINNLKVATTSFEKKHYATWIHPRSKKLHQIDHFIVNRKMFHRVIDAGLTPQLLDSDHYAIFMKLRIMKRLKKNTQTRSRMLNLDYSIINNPQNRINFCEEVLNNILTYLGNLNHSLDGFKLVRKNFLHSLKLGMKQYEMFYEKELI